MDTSSDTGKDGISPGSSTPPIKNLIDETSVAKNYLPNPDAIPSASSSTKSLPVLSSATQNSIEILEAGDLITAYLQLLGVEFVFGVTGGAIEPFYNALARSGRSGGPSAVVARYETGAAFMAEGYARNSGLLVVCCSTTGPGATNLLTGVASAYEGGIPMLVITAQTAIVNFGRKPLQESDDTGLNTVGIFKYCTHYNSLISHIEQFEHKLISAIVCAYSCKGPVHLSVPLDIMKSKPNIDRPSYDIAKLVKKPVVHDERSITNIFGELISSKKCVFIVARDCLGAMNEILSVAAHINADLVTTPDGKGLINPRHPQFKGVISFAGHDCAEQSLLNKSVDTILAIGSNMGEWSTNGLDKSTVLNQRMIHISSDDSFFARSPMARMHVSGNIRKIFSLLLNELQDWNPRKLNQHDGNLRSLHGEHDTERKELLQGAIRFCFLLRVQVVTTFPCCGNIE